MVSLFLCILLFASTVALFFHTKRFVVSGINKLVSFKDKLRDKDFDKDEFSLFCSLIERIAAEKYALRTLFRTHNSQMIIITKGSVLDMNIPNATDAEIRQEVEWDLMEIGKKRSSLNRHFRAYLIFCLVAFVLIFFMIIT